MRPRCSSCGQGRNRHGRGYRFGLCRICFLNPDKRAVAMEEPVGMGGTVVCPHCEGGRLQGSCCVCLSTRRVPFETALEACRSVWARALCACQVCQHLEAFERRIFAATTPVATSTVVRLPAGIARGAVAV